MPQTPFEFDSAYVNALRQGDSEVEAHFIEYFSPILLRILRYESCSIDLARDLRQETFLRVLLILRSGYSVREPKRFEAFVKSICKNIVHETKRQERPWVELSMLEIEPAIDFSTAYTLLLAAETRDLVRQILSQLASHEQEILTGLFLDEQNKDEICLRLGVSRNYLRVLLHRAKKQFRSQAQKI